ncbi:ATP-binding protein [Mycobacterium deserti]|uniref:Nuclease SbcCD subunit C n=1 Tax=Mycobacterium deserti TaxID=2978347 RepID=A0ABT2MFF9_9MYCO|nr:AAA family ATPase [Mycobacterium deserti]MCT7661008.1 AAA family ATPase [Mycobacterium deserti]
MLKTLTLHNWRNYDDLTVTFGQGTTFVVASNGVGKTSLVEAARWALFGTAAPGVAAVRNGRTEAVAFVELSLPDGRSLTVERTIQAQKRKAELAANVAIDGKAVHGDELPRLLKDVYGAEPWFLAGATMPSADRSGGAPAWRLREHLGQYYGVDSLSVAVDNVKRLQKETEAAIRSIKQANASSAKALNALQDAKEEAGRSAEAANVKYLDLQQRMKALRDNASARAALEKWTDEQTRWTTAVQLIATDLSGLLGKTVAATAVEETLDDALSGISSRLESIRVRLAVLQASKDLLVANDQRLGDAHEDCPVCRRPLDDATVNIAHDVNKRDIQALDAQQVSLRDDEAKASAEQVALQKVRTQWRSVPHLPPAPPTPPAESDTGSVEDLEVHVQAAFTELVNARASSNMADKEYEEAVAADDAMRELAALFRRSAKLQVAIDATERTLKEVLDSNVRPLAAEINRRWDALFPGRGGLSTSSDGEISRTVNGLPLPFDSFSTGEGMGANILLRLLVTQLATKADFCWFDEPLEHLDPDARRKVASLLTRVTSGGQPFRQVVVTTYEEPLARQLKIRDDNWVTLLDVRQESRVGDQAAQ